VFIPLFQRGVCNPVRLRLPPLLRRGIGVFLPLSQRGVLKGQGVHSPLSEGCPKDGVFILENIKKIADGLGVDIPTLFYFPKSGEKKNLLHKSFRKYPVENRDNWRQLSGL